MSWYPFLRKISFFAIQVLLLATAATPCIFCSLASRSHAAIINVPDL